MNQTNLSKKRRNIIKRLIDLSVLPEDKFSMNVEQTEIYNQIWDYNFSHWERIKEENGWINYELKSPEEKYLTEKRGNARTQLRKYGILPPYGDPLSEGQQKIINQIEENDFSYYESVKVEHRIKTQNKNNQTKRTSEEIYLSNRRGTIRSKLRKYGILPPYGDPLTEEQQKIIDQIEENDFSYYESVKKGNGNKANYEQKEGDENFASTTFPKHVLHRLRLLSILPPIGDLITDEQQAIYDDVYENWRGKKKSFFSKKYLHLSTPEGRIFCRAYHSHHEYGFNFNLTIDDIVIPEYCPLLNIKLSTDPDDKSLPNYYTIDRIDSSKGLVKGNIQIISLKANTMKSKATELELLQFATNGLKLIENGL